MMTNFLELLVPESYWFSQFYDLQQMMVRIQNLCY